MDFTFDESQLAVAGLAEQIFSGRASVERVKEIERTEDRVDRALWAELARANLLGISLPEDHGGSGLGITELCLVLEQQGRRVAPIPLVWSTVAAQAIAEFGGPADLLSRAVSGDAILTIALSGQAGDPMAPTVEAEPDGKGYRLTGARLSVPAGHVADRILTTARIAGGDQIAVVLIDPAAAGVRRERAEATNRELLTHLELSGAVVDGVDVVAGPPEGARAARFVYERALVGIAALQLGVAEEALAQAASYTSNRIQFGKPLSSFQSTAVKAADAYIDIEAMRATLWQAAWRIDHGLDAAVEVEVAKWWASEGGQRVVHTTQHLHGGMGADIEYPIHRYFLWGKQIEDTLGGGSAHLARIGTALAESLAGARP